MTPQSGNKRLYSIVFGLGLLSMVAQIAFLRITAINFYGNELTMCLVLGHWLLWTSLGSFWGSRQLRRERLADIFNLTLVYAFLLLVFSLLLLMIRQIFGISNSEMLGLGKIFLWTFAITALPAFANGLFFPMLTERISRGASGPVVEWIYALDVLGAMTGGLYFVLLISVGLNTFQTLYGTIILFLSLTAILIIQRGQWKRIVMAFLGIMICAGMIACLPEIYTVKWKPYPVLDFTETDHIALTTVEYGGAVTLFGNNEPLWTVGESESAEEIVHFGMLMHPDPDSVLLIGQMNPDIGRELARYPSMRHLKAIHSDRKMQRTIDALAPPPRYPFTLDVVHADPMNYIRQENGNYDVVLLNIPLPVNAELNRFYTVEFYTQLERCLDPLGLICMQFPAGESFITHEHAEFLKSMELTLRSAFPYTVWIPGETAHLIGSKSELYANYELFVKRLAQLAEPPRYVREYYLADRLSPLRFQFFTDQLSGVLSASLNTLRRPIGYYYDTVLWAQRFDGGIKTIYQYLHGKSPVFLVGLFALVFLLIAAALNRWRSPAAIFHLNMATVGFLLMSFEGIIIILFQSYVGGLYLRVTLLTMAFMFGAGLGALCHLRVAAWLSFVKFNRLILLLFLMFSGVMLLIHFQPAPVLIAIITPTIMVVAGFANGLVFPALSRLTNFHSGDSQGAKVGKIYAWDIIGSCAGIYLISVIVLPVYGIQTALGLLVSISVLLWAANRSFACLLSSN